MPTDKRFTPPADVAALGERIEHWRSTRTKLGAMPRAFWVEAGRLAREHGVYTIAKSLRLNFEALRGWSEDTKKERQEAHRRPAFVELGSLPALAPSCMTVDLASTDGSKMTIRIPGGGTSELMALVGTFFHEDRRR